MMKQAFNPYLPSYEYVPDGEPYVFGDRVYVYGSHDKFNGKQYCEKDYVCWSAPTDDLSNWKYEGVIYRKTLDPMGQEDKRMLYAPDVQQGPDGRFYLYYAFDFLGVMAVAVCDSPAGKYEFYGHVHYKDGTLLGSREGDAFQFDPGVLVDDDGRVYLYSGFCPVNFPWKYLGFPEQTIKGGMVIELEQDMITVKEDPKVIFPDKARGAGTDFEGHEFFEASSIRKIDDTYYFIYSSFNGHELCYATSKSPTGGFKYGGTIISNGDIYLGGRTDEEALNYTGNNHGSIVKINGKWYVFYHRQTNKHQFSRQACAEEITIESDGRIQQVEMTSCGLNGGPLLGKGEYPAYIACNLMSKTGAFCYEFGQSVDPSHPFFTQDGEDREDLPNQHIANLTDGALAGFKYFDFEEVSRISVKVRGTGNGKLQVRSAIGGDLIAEVSISPSSEWGDLHAPLTLDRGVHALYFTYKGEGAIDLLSFTLD
ncbi:family 43 glycosylhydrolase [Paenibacillus sp. LHD-117]|uniref:family 43 glycosylhydrolase n=1 Tax=Paenibacillus sp. LHD-117 TaxID=3071412 RepID=UPI0027E0CE08|nr:family 43 glycosylhydrolase [Paenibacillus sp. LHD-117]MDQ6420188.1 family 43 glycosylhydrolase [Paenibacillus sp. LHD-117]